jgi:hypothetical protein
MIDDEVTIAALRRSYAQKVAARELATMRPTLPTLAELDALDADVRRLTGPAGAVPSPAELCTIVHNSGL